METPLKLKIKFILTMLISTVTVVVFSFLFALAAQTATIKAGVEIEYYAGEGATLKKGELFRDSYLNENCGTIVFDYGTKHPQVLSNRSSYAETKVDVNSQGYDNGGISLFYNSITTEAYVLSQGKIFANENCYGMFMNKTKLTSITFNNFDTSKVTTMEYMFAFCGVSNELDLSCFNTENVTNMRWMFDGCSELIGKLDLSNFNMFNVINISSMFKNCKKLEEIIFSNEYEAKNIEYIMDLFSGCESLTAIDLSSFNTAKVDDGLGMSGMFQNCKNLTNIIFGENFNTSKVEYMGGMFFGCSSLTSLDLSGWDTSKADNMGFMFYNCSSLTALNLSSWNTNLVEDMQYMFDNCKSLTTIYVSSGWSTSAVTSSSRMFTSCAKLVGGAGTKYDSYSTDVAYAKIDETSSKGYLTASYSLISGEDFSDLITLYNPARVVFGKYSSYSSTVSAATNIVNASVSVIPDESASITEDIKIYVSTISNVKYFHVLSDSPIIANEDCSNMFYSEVKLLPLAVDLSGISKITNITFSNFNTYNTTIMDSMFTGCSKLSSISLNRFDTSKVTSMNSMFNNCSELTSLSTSYLKTDVVTDMSSMFSGCSKLTSLTFGTNFKTENCLDMRSMFYNCSKLTSLNLSNFDTNNVTSMSSMFYNCSALTTLTLGSNFKTDNVTTMASMFNGCKLLTEVPISNFVTSKVTTMASMFANCTGLTSLDLSNISTENVTTMAAMFSGSTGLISLNLSNFNTSNVTTFARMFVNCTSLTSLDLSSFSTLKTTGMEEMFEGCTGLTEIKFGNEYTTEIVTNMNYVFRNCSALTSLDLSSFNIEKVTKMNSMFNGCTNLQTIYVNEDWEVGSSTAGSAMFIGCANLVGENGTKCSEAQVYDKTYAKIDGLNGEPGYLSVNKVILIAGKDFLTKLCYGRDSMRQRECESLVFDYYDPVKHDEFINDSNINAQNVGLDETKGYLNGGATLFYNSSTNEALVLSEEKIYANPDCEKMFANRQNLTSIEFNNFNTSKVTNMLHMFYYCVSLEELDLSGWNTESLTDVRAMFIECSSLTSIIGLDSWSTKSILSMRLMFADCSSLTSLNLSNWDLNLVEDMDYIFTGCTNLQTIYVSESWEVGSSTSGEGMFEECISLVGGNGTKYSEVRVYDKTYAKIDGLNGKPGYLTNALTTLTQGLDFNSIVSEINPAKLIFAYGEEYPNIVASYLAKAIPVDVGKGGYQNDGISLFHDSTTNTSYVLSKEEMFANQKCSYMFSSLETTEIYFSNFNTKQVIDCNNMFSSCKNLKTLTFPAWVNFSNANSFYGMFQNCSELTTVDLSNLKTSNVETMAYMFSGCLKLTTVYINDMDSNPENDLYWNTMNVSESDEMFAGCESLVGEMGTKCSVKQVYDKTCANKDIKTMRSGYFSSMHMLAADVISSKINSDAKKIIFDYAYKYPTITSTLSSDNMTIYDLSLDEGGIRYYYDSTSKTAYVLSKYTIVCYDSIALFKDRTTLDTVLLTNFNTYLATSMQQMFNGCSALTSLDLRILDTSNVTTMESMFSNCLSLTNLDLSSFDTSNVTTMESMFDFCKSITKLDLSSYNTSKVKNMYSMFFACVKLETIYVGDGWTVESLLSNGKEYIFSNCSNLKGDISYDPNYVDETYATYEGGYLTYKELE